MGGDYADNPGFPRETGLPAGCESRLNNPE